MPALGALLAVGAASILGQVVLLRELLVLFAGSELVVVLGLAGWLLGAAVGAGLGSRRDVEAATRLGWTLLALGAAVPACLVSARLLRQGPHVVPGAMLTPVQQALALLVVLGPAAVAGGAAFRLAARRWSAAPGRTLAEAYAVESVGGLVGGALATGGLGLGIGNLGLGALGALLAVGGAAASRAPRLPAVGLAALLVALAVVSGRVDVALTRVTHPDLVATRKTPYGRITVTAREGQVVVFHDDALGWESEGVEAERFVHLAALQVARPERVLLLGGLTAGLVGPLLDHHPREVEVVEIDASLVELARPWLPSGADAAAVRLVVDDPRRALARGGRFDLIVVGLPAPTSGQANRAYTREFFQTCHDRLAPGGVLAFRLGASEALWPPLLVRRNASVLRALGLVFDRSLVLGGDPAIVLAGAVSADPEPLVARLSQRGIDARLVTAPYLAWVMRDDRVARIREWITASEAPPNTDARPVCYGDTLLLQLSRTWPRLAAWAPRPGPGTLAVLSVALLLGVAVARRTDRGRRVGLASLAGLSGMVLEATILLRYQADHGVLYRDLGLLTTVFMGGLALGAAAGGPLLRGRHAGLGLLGALAALDLGTAFVVAGGSPALVLMLCLFGGGFTTSLLFALAAREGDQRGLAGPLYAADLAGGVVGALAGGLLLLPWYGLAPTVVMLSVVALVGLLLVGRAPAARAR